MNAPSVIDYQSEAAADLRPQHVDDATVREIRGPCKYPHFCWLQMSTATYHQPRFVRILGNEIPSSLPKATHARSPNETAYWN
jgi:hypothetical protein